MYVLRVGACGISSEIMLRHHYTIGARKIGRLDYINMLVQVFR